MQREQKYSKSLKFWLDDIRRAIRGLYTRNPNFKIHQDENCMNWSPYYERNNTYKDWEEFVKSWEEQLYDRTDVFDLIIKDVESFENDIKNLEFDNNQLKEKYDDLLDLLVEQRELLPIEWLDKQGHFALGAVVGSPLDVVAYANMYIKELQEK